MDLGRICKKTKGREAGSECVVIDVVDQNFVLIDGPEVRRRRCNVRHLEPLDKRADVSKGAPTEEVTQALEKSIEEKPEDQSSESSGPAEGEIEEEEREVPEEKGEEGSGPKD